jgi:arsenate reductase (thioredoxin)
MAPRTYNVLFLCTGNSARSVMAEALLEQLGQGRFRAFSAGSYPAGKINPFAEQLLKSKGFRTDHLRSKSWDEFARPGAPAMDFVFTVCDNAAGEQCPVWPGHPATAHWGFEDPAAFQGPDAEKRRVFEKVFQEISARIRLFLALPLDKIDRLLLQSELHRIGKTRPAAPSNARE